MGTAGVSAGGGGGGAWTDPDLANASYDTVSFSVANEEASFRGFFLKPDGTKLYVTGSTGDDVNEYNLSTAWDVSTSVYSQNKDISNEEINPSNVFFKPDGTKMYILGRAGDDVNEYDLSTAWDVTTAVYSQNKSIASQDANSWGLFFKPDGTKMYVCGITADKVFEYDLSTAWDVTTASHTVNQDHYFGNEDTFPRAINFNPDGSKMWMAGDTNAKIFEYDLSTNWDVTTSNYNNVSLDVSGQITDPFDFRIKSDGSKIYVGGSSNIIYQYSTVAAASSWTDPDLVNASYDSVSLDVSGQESRPNNVFFKPDGTKMYVLGQGDDEVNEYDLSPAWDISTASHNQNFSVAGQEIVPMGIYFKPDGTKMFICGAQDTEVLEYVLSTAWNISTASYINNFFSTALQDTTPIDLVFSTDGTKMFIVGSSNDTVFEYSLSSAWNISTASYYNNFFSTALQENNPKGLFFNPDGDKMFIVGAGSKTVFQYSLSTDYDVSSASYDNISFPITSQVSNPSSLFFKSDGSKMYTTHEFLKTIYQYST